MSKRLLHEKIIGENIRKQRRAMKLTQERLAEKADLHPVYLGQVERGEESVSVRALARIARALKVPMKELVDGVR
ncbi:MAG TPA: helix-turn-helix transcriptional regulator [Desulfuromonadaceae bacterium]|nr:helix-turn-helix transcriptional regulator [Desulfuromonadaceae bacterium]